MSVAGSILFSTSNWYFTSCRCYFNKRPEGYKVFQRHRRPTLFVWAMNCLQRSLGKRAFVLLYLRDILLPGQNKFGLSKLKIGPLSDWKPFFFWCVLIQGVAELILRSVGVHWIRVPKVTEDKNTEVLVSTGFEWSNLEKVKAEGERIMSIDS